MTIHSTKTKGQGGGKFSWARNQAFTLAEVMISFGLSVMFVGGMIYGYVGTAKRAEWSGYNLAAQSMANQGLEMARAARWDISTTPITDELVQSNFPPMVSILDMPIVRTGTSSNAVFATNIFTITTLQTNPPLKCIRVDCYWPYATEKTSHRFTNTAVTYRAP